MTENIEVVVIGGGYAGVMAANRLRMREGLSVTVINPRPRFVERIRLHQLAAGSGAAVAEYDEVLGQGIRLIVDEAVEIDAVRRSVALRSGGNVAYDYLIYAVGSHGAAPTVPGAAEYAYALAEFEQAERLREALAVTDPAAPVTVVGAGPTGIETAAELAEAGRTVTLVCGGLLGPYLRTPARRSVARRLTGLGVTIVDGPHAKVAAVTAHTVVLGDGRELPSAITVWTAGFGVPDLATRSGLSTDALGRLRTDETLTSIDDPRILATGDAAAPTDHPLRMSCQAAIPLGVHAADTVLSRLADAEPPLLNIGFVGQCISLGRRAATVQPSRLDDTPMRFYLGGRPAASIKEAVCKSTVWSLRREARRPGSAFTTKGGKRQQRLAATNPVAPLVK
ncbi:FAD-dependent oxidoreductase [Nocardia sp. ET3-3]|uniref:FAD-dependent oxidoreductase n=1 Tax=Nocardia terrae TaxID=2675851 RepID=A0A7K1UW11_9NOCA|nr:FAD-dependent oxidoreductase [Nocardia terrae]MVU78564.1 FAD-dependent oxidoreductase [Nocardia terrae]